MAEAAKAALDPIELVHHVNAAFFDAADKIYTQPVQVALYRAVAALGRDAKPVLRDWTVLHPGRFAKSNEHMVILSTEASHRALSSGVTAT